MTEVGGDLKGLFLQTDEGTLTPLVPLPLRACKGEGEERIGASVCALRTPMPLIRYQGKGTEMDSRHRRIYNPIGVGNDGLGKGVGEERLTTGCNLGTFLCP